MARWIALLTAALLAAGLCACETRAPQPAEEPSAAESEIVSEEGASENTGQSQAESEQDEQEAREAERAASDFLDALQSGDRERIRAQTDYTELLQIQEGDPDANLLAILKRMEYEVIGAVVDGDAASVKVSITNIDMNAVLPTYIKQAMELEYNNAISESPLTPEQLEQEYVKLFDGALNYNAINTVERAVDLELAKADGVWRVRQDEHLRSAAFGDFWSASSKVGENAR